MLGVYANLMTRPNVVEILRVRERCWLADDCRRPGARAYTSGISRRRGGCRVIGEGEITLEELLPVLHGRVASVAGRRLRNRISARRAATSSRQHHGSRFATSMHSPGRRVKPSTWTVTSRSGAKHHGTGVGVVDHGARLPLPLPVVQPSGVRQDPSPPEAGISSR